MINQAKSIISPWSGATVRPQLKELRVGNELRVEAHYTCPSTGRFITKIVVETRKFDAGSSNS
tara:strand:- start:3897 stop:4085 length:189 start_codon:yes stop_codon:yes gene_type:complete